ncbi:MAG: SDR family NAD(P)-dependent oxidoreductase, partial [Sneathiella sp.]
MGRLENKVAIITGGTSGIGLSTAEIFAQEGATVVFTGRRAEEGAAIASKLGNSVHFVQADATVEADMAALMADTVQKFGQIDCLFNNAGGPAPVGSIETVD